MKKIVIVTSDNRTPKFEDKKNNFLESCALINFKYAIKNKCDFYFVKIKDDFENKFLTKKDGLASYSRIARSCKAASWTKLLVIYNFLKKKYKYIIYLDSDCIFNNQKEPIGKLIDSLKNKKMLFFSDRPWKPNLPNCGFILIKNNSFNKNFIKKWWQTFSKKNLKHPYEQYWLQKFWLENSNFINKNFELIPNEICRLNNEKQYIFHMTSDFSKSRDSFFSNYIHQNKLNINFLKKKIKLKIINFSPKIEDKKIAKRLLTYVDYTIIYITLFYMIIKNLFFYKPKIFFKKIIND